jgi:hypothetical protein
VSGKISPCERCGREGAETIFGHYQSCKYCDAPAVPEPVAREKTDKIVWTIKHQGHPVKITYTPPTGIITSTAYLCVNCNKVTSVTGTGLSSCCLCRVVTSP